MTARITVTPDSAALAAAAQAFARMAALGQRPRSIWNAIGQYGETSTRLRFKAEKGPDGQRWKPSRRAKKTGGKTLQLTARLLRSITYNASSTGAEWGSNVVYAGIHQAGGRIERPAYSSTLRLRTQRGGALLRQGKAGHLAVFAKARHKQAVERRYTVGAYTIDMPARPYLGINAEDGREMLDLAEQAVDAAAAGGAV